MFFSKSGVNIALGVQFEEMGFPRWMFWVAVSFILVRALVDIILTLLARLFNSDAEGENRMKNDILFSKLRTKLRASYDFNFWTV